MSKKFKTFEEQINLLIANGLTVINKDKLKWYLKSYNYQNIINGYNDFFMLNNDRKSNRYKKESNSDAIIELFNFDRSISKTILSSIQNIERMLSTAIAYTITEIMNNEGYTDGKVFNIDDNDIVIKKLFIVNDKENKFILLKDSFQKTYIKNNDMKKNMYSKYKNFNDIPLWSIIISSTFGNIICFLKSVKENIFFEIMKNSNIKNWQNLSKGELIKLFSILKDIRNRICHNNVLYNISISNEANKNIIKKFLDKSNLAHSSKMKLYEIVKTIEKIDPNVKCYLSDYIDDKISNFKEVHQNIVSDIVRNIWYKK